MDIDHVVNTDEIESKIILGDPDEDDFVVDESGKCYLSGDNSKLLHLSCLSLAGGTIESDEITIRFTSEDYLECNVLNLRFVLPNREHLDLVNKLFLDLKFPLTTGDKRRELSEAEVNEELEGIDFMNLE